MAFFTNVFTLGDLVYYRGIKSDGSHVKKQHKYAPYMFMENPNATLYDYRTIDDKRVERIDFKSMSEARRFIAKYKDIAGVKVYGLNQFQYTFIRDLFPDEIEYDSSLIKIGYLDIEVAAEDASLFTKEGMSEAKFPITAITILYRDVYFVFACGDFITDRTDINYYHCKDEKDLFEEFLRLWDDLDLDIITGWNIRFFDIPYLVNRINKICGETKAMILSPWLIIEEKIIEVRGKENISYELYGITTLDYLELYRKFTFKNHESYKLEDISQKELKEGKLAYKGLLLDLHKNDFQKFIEYNIRDVELVKRLEEKKGFIELVLSLAYDAKCNYIDVLTTIRPWDVIIHNYLLDHKIVIPPSSEHKLSKSIMGGHVKEPKKGFSNWIVGFDLRSLYPHIMMMYNISPDTYLGKFGASYKIDENANVLLIDAPIGWEDTTITANGCMYRKDKQGFMAALMESKFKDRAFFQKKMREAQTVGDTKTQHLFKNKQHAKKIQLNSLYGALVNEYNRWFSFDNGEAVTTTGQLVIKFVDKALNKFLNEYFSTKDEDYIVASDTDSVFINLEKYVNLTALLKTDDDKVDALKEFCMKVIEPFLEKKFEEFAKVTRAYEQKLFMKRETISSKGLWRAKKMYILNVLDNEGVRNDPPDLKMTGIGAVRSSTPDVCKENIKKAINIIMSGAEKDLIQFIKEFKTKYKTLPYEEIAMPRGVSKLEEYSHPSTIYKLKTPVQVKASLLYNKYLEKQGLKNLEPIRSGDKIKFCYLKLPNPIRDTCIASPGDLPKELGLDRFIDYEKQFERSFLLPLQLITEAINWNIDNRATLERFFNEESILAERLDMDDEPCDLQDIDISQETQEMD